MAIQGSGQTLENLFINVASRYTGGEQMRRADRDVDKLDQRVTRLGNTLQKIGVAFAVFATASVKAFSENERAMSEFAGKAGLSLAKFEKQFGRMSANIARQAGVNRNIILQGLQEGYSMGLSPKQLEALGPLAAKLHAGRQADFATSLTAAAQAYNAGFGSPAEALRTTYAAAQKGSGAVSDYGQVFKKVAPFAGAAGVNMNLVDTLAAMGILGGQAESLSLGGTWMRSWLIAMLNPKKEARAIMESRTGKTFGDLRAMMQAEGGIVEVMRLIKDNFKPDELFKLYGREEAVSFLNAVDPDALAKQIAAVREGVEGKPIESFWSHFSKTLTRTFASFKEALDRFLESFGAPVVWLLKRLMEVGGVLLDVLVTLNKYTFGLLGAITTLVGTLGLAVAAFRVLRFTLGGAIVASIGDKIGDAVSRSLGVDKDGKGGSSAGKGKGSNLGLWATMANIVITVFAFFRNIRSNFTAFMRDLSLGWGNANRFTSSDFYQHGVRGDKRNQLFTWMNKGNERARWATKILVPLATTTGKMLTKLTIIAAVLTSVFTLFRWFTRNTEAAQNAIRKAAESRRLRSHFEAGGKLDDEAPLPGSIDALDIEAEQLDVWRKAETRTFVSGLGNAFKTLFTNILKIFLPESWEAPVLKAFSLYGDIFTKVWGGIIDFLHAPLYYIELGWKHFSNFMDRQEAKFIGWLNDKFGFNISPSLRNQRSLNAPLADGTTALHTLRMDAAEAKALGLNPTPETYQQSPQIDLRQTMRLPSLPVPRMRRMDELGYTREQIRQSWLNQANPNITVNNTINIDGTVDPEAVAKAVKREQSRAIWEAIENAESPLAP